MITNGVTPSLPVSYKWTRIKQYHKEGRALRTETTINDTRDFAIGKRLHNLSALREVGFSVRHRRRQLPFPTASEGPIQHHGHAASEPQPRPPPQGGVGASGCLCRVGPGAKGGSSPLVGPQPGPGLSDHVRRDPQQAEPLG